MRTIRAWWVEHRDWPRDTWVFLVLFPLGLACLFGVFDGGWWVTTVAVIFYVLGGAGHRLWVATGRYVEKRREFALIHRRDGLPPPDGRT